MNTDMPQLNSRFNTSYFVMDMGSTRIRFSAAGRTHYNQVLAPLGIDVTKIHTLPDLTNAFRRLREIELLEIFTK